MDAKKEKKNEEQEKSARKLSDGKKRDISLWSSCFLGEERMKKKSI